MKFLALEYVADNDNAYFIEQNHRHSKQRLRDNVRRGRDDSGDNEGNKDNVALEFHQHFRADDAKVGKQRQDNRHVEGKAEGHDEHEQEVQIAFHRNKRIDLACSKAEEKLQTAREDEAVGK